MKMNNSNNNNNKEKKIDLCHNIKHNFKFISQETNLKYTACIIFVLSSLNKLSSIKSKSTYQLCIM